MFDAAPFLVFRIDLTITAITLKRCSGASFISEARLFAVFGIGLNGAWHFSQSPDSLHTKRESFVVILTASYSPVSMQFVNTSRWRPAISDC
jgi:hypothetical protein